MTLLLGRSKRIYRQNRTARGLPDLRFSPKNAAARRVVTRFRGTERCCKPAGDGQ